MEHDYIVEGMTCRQCVLSVQEGLSEVPGVDQASVDLASGRVTVTGAGFSNEDVRDAVEEAGYALASSRPSAA